MQVLSGAIGRERLHFEAPPRDQLEGQLEAFLNWIASPPAALDGLVRAGLAHLWFLTLHPYEDGNGRLAQAIAVIDAVQRKAAFWWSHRHSGFNSRQQKLLNRLLDAEPEGFTGGMTLRKAISLTKVSRATAWRDLAELVDEQAIEPVGEGRSRAYRICWPVERRDDLGSI